MHILNFLSFTPYFKFFITLFDNSSSEPIWLCISLKRKCTQWSFGVVWYYFLALFFFFTFFFWKKIENSKDASYVFVKKKKTKKEKEEENFERETISNNPFYFDNSFYDIRFRWKCQIVRALLNVKEIYVQSKIIFVWMPWETCIKARACVGIIIEYYC